MVFPLEVVLGAKTFVRRTRLYLVSYSLSSSQGQPSMVRSYGCRFCLTSVGVPGSIPPILVFPVFFWVFGFPARLEPPIYAFSFQTARVVTAESSICLTAESRYRT